MKGTIPHEQHTYDQALDNYWCNCTLSGHVQDQEHMRCPGACGALMDLWRGIQGEHVPAECLSRNVMMYSVGRILVPCANCLYGLVLTLQCRQDNDTL